MDTLAVPNSLGNQQKFDEPDLTNDIGYRTMGLSGGRYLGTAWKFQECIKTYQWG